VAEGDNPVNREHIGLLSLFGAALFVVTSIIATSSVLAQTEASEPDDPFVLAHYYIWFDENSWNRAKIDYPTMGRYSSDEPSTMRRHIELAKEAGIDGFIVSWKSTAVLDARLEQLIAIADELDFKLAITYQSLDFNRDPLPVDRIEEDLDLLIANNAHSSVFDLFEKPLVVLTGTWKFTPEEIAEITTDRRDELFILASEKDVEGYRRISQFVDGDLYYWSSVRPQTNGEHPGKLADMGAAVRSQGGIWIAPAAPGFDARLVGGTSVVERLDGDTLRRSWQAALGSLPDAIGIISWNEFSENTHVEPSVEHGASSLEVVADLTGAPTPSAIDFDSSAPAGPRQQSITPAITIALFVTLLVGSVTFIRRRSKNRADPTLPIETEHGKS
jgi:hypothetical protein